MLETSQVPPNSHPLPYKNNPIVDPGEAYITHDGILGDYENLVWISLIRVVIYVAITVLALYTLIARGEQTYLTYSEYNRVTSYDICASTVKDPLLIDKCNYMVEKVTANKNLGELEFFLSPLLPILTLLGGWLYGKKVN